jgi:hypothetical protein
MPLNVNGQNVALDGLDESITAGIKDVGINSLTIAPPSDCTPGTAATPATTEAIGGAPGYVRQAVTWGAAAAGQKTNSGALTFDVPAGTYGFFSLWNAVSGSGAGAYLGYLPFGGTSPIKGFGEVRSGDLAGDLINSDAHGLVNGDRVILYNVLGESLPAGLTEGAAYFVVGAAAGTFQVSNTLGGGAVDITGAGELYFQKVVPEVFGSQGQITVAIGQLILDATAV